MTASLIFIQKDASFTGGEDMNFGSLGKMCCLAVWDLKEVSPSFLAGLFLLTVTSSLNNRTTS